VKVQGGRILVDPRPLPAGVPRGLASLVRRMLAQDPAQRPQSAEEALTAVEALAEREQEKRIDAGRLARLRVAAPWAVAALFALLSLFLLVRGGSAPPADTDLAQRLAEGDYAAARGARRRRRAARPDDDALRSLLASTLVASAEARARAGDPWEGQRLAGEAAALEPGRRAVLERLRAAARERLAGLVAEVAAVTAEPVVRVALRGVPLRSMAVDGVPGRIDGDHAEAVLDLPDGEHEATVRLRDAAGNERALPVRFTVDRTPPELEVLAPAEGQRFATSRVEVRARVRDAHPPAEIRIHDRSVPVVEGAAATALELPDGSHTLTVVARDCAGNETSLRRGVLVVSTRPRIELEAERLFTRDGRVTVRGVARSKGTEVRVDGRRVETGPDGAFETVVEVADDTRILVEGRNAAGVRVGVPVSIVVDTEPPRVEPLWPRREGRRVLYGAKEIAAGRLRLPLSVTDESPVTLEPDQGTVEDLLWHLPAREGARRVGLRARDAAGNSARFEVDVEGSRSTPRLSVAADVRSPTNAVEALLVVDCDAPLTVQGKASGPGRLTLPLPEGAVDLVVRAVDRYGNEARWTRHVIVDRTPPRVRLAGGAVRHVGRQQVELEADEPLASAKVSGRAFQPDGKKIVATVDLREGR
ncbi:MAG: hypothetical protein ACE5JG_11255, partial [Planctomycetota bacterium]